MNVSDLVGAKHGAAASDFRIAVEMQLILGTALDAVCRNEAGCIVASRSSLRLELHDGIKLNLDCVRGGCAGSGCGHRSGGAGYAEHDGSNGRLRHMKAVKGLTARASGL